MTKKNYFFFIFISISFFGNIRHRPQKKEMDEKGRKELVVSGQRLFTVNDREFFLHAAHILDHNDLIALIPEIQEIKEFVVTKDCHLPLSPVFISPDKAVKSFSRLDNDCVLLLCIGSKVVVQPDVEKKYVAPTQINFGRKMFVVHGQAFYLSSGTSDNGEGTFPNVSFPFKGVNFQGWFVKCYGHETNDWLSTLLERFPSNRNRLFFLRFESFFQLRISALVKADPDTYWDEVRPLYRFVLRNEWDADEKVFKKAKIPLIRKPLRNAPIGIDNLKYNWSHIQVVNDWLNENGAKVF